VSLYCLVLFYMATEEQLKPFRPLSKFLCIKAIIFFSYWQGCLIVLLQQLGVFDAVAANQAQNHLILFELMFAALAQSFAFSYQVFVTRESDTRKFLQAVGYVLNVKEVINDAHSTFLGAAVAEEDPESQMGEVGNQNGKYV